MTNIEVEYETFNGWPSDSTSKCRSFDELPANAKVFVKYIERFLNVPIKWIGVGKARDEIIRVF